jgi:hypothetical protein
VSGVGVEDEPRLWDVSMQSVVHDEHAQELLLGRTLAAAEYRSPQAAFDDLSYWETLVPEWAPRVRDELAARGVPFAVELLASPEINLSDPSKPLFGKGEAPSSLFQLGVLQDGENDFLRSVSAEELMLEVWPDYWRYFHRPAGSPVPADLRAGMTFGSPVLQDDGTYLRSPVMSTNSYMRWLAYGYPGYTVDETAARGLRPERLRLDLLLHRGVREVRAVESRRRDDRPLRPAARRQVAHNLSPTRRRPGHPPGRLRFRAVRAVPDGCAASRSVAGRRVGTMGRVSPSKRGRMPKLGSKKPWKERT